MASNYRKSLGPVLGLVFDACVWLMKTRAVKRYRGWLWVREYKRGLKRAGML